MPIFLLPLIVFGTVVFLVLALTAPTETMVQARLRDYGYRLGNRDLSEPFSARVLFPMVGRLASIVRRLSPSLMEEDIRARLDRAGRPARLDVNGFLAAKAVGLVALPVLVLFFPLLRGEIELRNVIVAIVVAVVGWKLPDLWLSGRIGDRKEKIERALPDALDLIVVCVEAGNALEAALANVTQKMKGPLAEELERTLREISLGKTRREALRDLSRRAGVADLQAFIAAILQADQLGVSIAQVLRVQADAVRVRRRQRAEEQAAKIPVKMLIPLVALIFPALIIVILAPAVLRMIDFFSNLRLP